MTNPMPFAVMWFVNPLPFGYAACTDFHEKA
jgi:hypothetical protein